MKTIKLTFIILLSGLMFTACEQDALTEDSNVLENSARQTELAKMVPFKAHLSSAPISEEPILCVDPITGEGIYGLIYSAVIGNATHLGKIDVNQSPLTILECSLNLEDGYVLTSIEMILRNKKGDGVRCLGDVTLFIEGPTAGYFDIVDGYGKFQGATGWISTEGQFDINTGTTVYTADGRVTKPNQ